MIVQIIHPRKGTWYSGYVGQEYEVVLQGEWYTTIDTLYSSWPLSIHKDDIKILSEGE